MENSYKKTRLLVTSVVVVISFLAIIFTSCSNSSSGDGTTETLAGSYAENWYLPSMCVL